MSEHFKAAGFKMRRMSALDEKIEKQEKANQVYLDDSGYETGY